MGTFRIRPLPAITDNCLEIDADLFNGGSLSMPFSDNTEVFYQALVAYHDLGRMTTLHSDR
jgi:hypothetical protein